jgi:hypothetical protein
MSRFSKKQTSTNTVVKIHPEGTESGAQGLTGVFRIIRCTRNTDIFRGSLFHMSDNDPDWKFHVSRGVKIP